MNEFTLLGFSGDTKDEKQNDKRLTNSNELQEMKAPDKIVQNVLNYSKALSIRKSTSLKFIKNVLN